MKQPSTWQVLRSMHAITWRRMIWHSLLPGPIAAVIGTPFLMLVQGWGFAESAWMVLGSIATPLMVLCPLLFLFFVMLEVRLQKLDWGPSGHRGKPW